MTPKYVHKMFFCIFIIVCINIVGGLKKESIIGGKKVENVDILHESSILVKGDTGDQPNAPCAAAAVDKDHLVTIASCFTDDNGEPFKRWYEAKVGAKNLLDKSVNAVGVEKIYIPENFKRKTLENNIAVIKLNQSLHFSIRTRVTKLDLPKSTSAYVNKVALLSGYGYYTVYGRAFSTGMSYRGLQDWHLRQLPYKVLNENECRKLNIFALNSQLYGLSIPLDPLGAGACVGDLGGPLVFQNQLIGVLSQFQPFCDDGEKPAVYTRVSYFKSFIQSVIDGTPPNNTRIDIDQTQLNEASTSIIM